MIVRNSNLLLALRAVAYAWLAALLISVCYYLLIGRLPMGIDAKVIGILCLGGGLGYFFRRASKKGK